jgi:hypothetical protein
MKPKRVVTMAQMFLMSDGTVETKISKKVPVAFIDENMSIALAGLRAAFKMGLVAQ